MAAELPGRTVKDPASISYKDSMADVFMAPESAMPLRLFTGNPEFPPDYIPERSRLIDVTHSLPFSSISDCLRLRPMDAIVTILYNYDPELLERFYARPDSDNWVVKYYRFTDCQERFDMKIKRWSVVIYVRSHESFLAATLY